MAWRFGFGPCGCCGCLSERAADCGFHGSYDAGNQLQAVRFNIPASQESNVPWLRPDHGDDNFFLCDGNTTYSRIDTSDGTTLTFARGTVIGSGTYGSYTYAADNLVLTTGEGVDTWGRTADGYWQHLSGPALAANESETCIYPEIFYLCTPYATNQLDAGSTAALTISGYDYTTCSFILWSWEGSLQSPNRAYTLDGSPAPHVSLPTYDGFYLGDGANGFSGSSTASGATSSFFFFWRRLTAPALLDGTPAPAWILNMNLSSGGGQEIQFDANGGASDYFATSYSVGTFAAPINVGGTIGSEACSAGTTCSSVVITP